MDRSLCAARDSVVVFDDSAKRNNARVPAAGEGTGPFRAAVHRCRAGAYLSRAPGKSHAIATDAILPSALHRLLCADWRTRRRVRVMSRSVALVEFIRTLGDRHVPASMERLSSQHSYRV